MKATIACLLLLPILFFSCKKDGSSGQNGNLVNNPSFETTSHQPDPKGWKITSLFPDSLGHHTPKFVADAPGGGGEWSLQLMPLWIPAEGFAETVVTGQSGTNIYLVSAWMKTIGWHGKLVFEQWRNGQKVHFKMKSDTAVAWKQLVFSDTLAILPTDTLKVHLTAGSTEVSAGIVRFDNIILKKMNP